MENAPEARPVSAAGAASAAAGGAQILVPIETGSTLVHP